MQSSSSSSAPAPPALTPTSLYGYANAAWAILKAVPLLLTPSLTLTAMEAHARDATGPSSFSPSSFSSSRSNASSRNTTDKRMSQADQPNRTGAELHLMRLLAFAHVALAILLLPNFSSSFDDAADTSQTVALSTRSLVAAVALHVATLVDNYTVYTNLSRAGAAGAGMVLGIAGAGVLASWGVWCLMFGDGGGVKRGGWIFPDAERRRRRVEKREKRFAKIDKAS